MIIVAGALGSILLILLIIIYNMSKRKFDYWEKKKVPYAKPTPFFGNYCEYIVLKKYRGQVAQNLCQQFPKEPYFGTFYGTEPALMIQSPEVIKQVLTRDFYYFNSREIADYTYKELITQNLFFIHGDRWKVNRQSLTPLFSTGKMRNMFHLIEKCTHQLETMLDDERAMSEVLEVRSLTSRYTMDCVCSCAFGIEAKAMEKTSERNPFTIMGETIFATSKPRGLKLIGRAMWPAIFYGLGFKCFPNEIQVFFGNLLSEVIKQRGNEPSSRNDFVDLMLTLKKDDYIVGESLTPRSEDGKKIKIKCDDDLITTQCVLFFAAGFETAALTFAHVLYELAKTPNVQKRAQDEVDAYLSKHNNKLDYDCITEMPYLEACLDETLRMYPAMPILTREVVDDYTFPTGLKVEKGLRIHVPLFHIHRNPENFPDPEEYRPERFLPGAKHKIKPYTFFPFGEGPRQCIGMRFGTMQVIAGLITILKKYNLELAEGMPRNVEFESTTILTQPKCGLYLKATLRNGWERRVLAT